MQTGKTAFRFIAMSGNIVSRGTVLYRTALLLKDVLCFVFFPPHPDLFFAQEKAHLQLSVEAADFISAFIIHHSYELYFRRSRPSYIATLRILSPNAYVLP